MSSSDNFKKFITNPNKYVSLIRSSNPYPKPKISILLPFGFDAEDLIKDVVDTFDLTYMDSCDIFKKNILPKNMPMVGKMYEEPTSKKIMDKYFIPEDENENYINYLRKYVNKDSVYLSDTDWMKMNSCFYKFNEGICYKNYPNSLTELKYLKDNEINPDVIIEIVVEKSEQQKHAMKAVAENWLIYQYTLIDKVIERDGTSRKNYVDRKTSLFKDKLAAIKRKNKKEKNKTISTETTDALEDSCTSTISSHLSDHYSRFSELTLKQKKIIIHCGLDKEDLNGLDDFATLERIDALVDEECPKPEFLISQCFPIGVTTPSDTAIKRHLNVEAAVLADMRSFAGSSGIPWKTVSSSGRDSSSRSATLDDIRRVLVNDADNDDGVFETAYDVDLIAVENMLRTGQVYLSGFGRWCPVRVNENADAVQHFYPDRAADRIFPVVHRNYVYFVSGPENRDKFVRRPLHYALRRTIARPHGWPYVPLRIAVVGAPKSGKSHCARELSARHGFQLIRIEEFAESWLSGAGRGRPPPDSRALRQTNALSDAALIEIVMSGMQTTRAVVQGFVLDGFPSTERQFELLNDTGVILHRVFVLDGSYERCASNNSRCAPDGGRVPDALLRHRHQMWTAAFVGEPWISECYGNAVADVRDCDHMDRSLRTFVESVREYRRDSGRGNVRPCRLTDIPVTRLECEYKMSAYRYTCPVCRVDDRCFSAPRDHGSRKRNLVQYRSFFYWTCGEHVDAFADYADRYVDAVASTVRVTEPLAVATSADQLSRDPSASFERYEFCTVCAVRTSRSWNTVYNRGDGSYVAVYAGRRFDFCSSQCRDDFMRRPFLYNKYAIRVEVPDEVRFACSRYGHLDVGNMPVPGYLEQTIQPLIRPALTKLTAIRPMYPGLSAEQSAKVFIGLYFGMNHRGAATAAAAEDEISEYYRIAYNRFVDTCQRFKTDIFKLKSVI